MNWVKLYKNEFLIILFSFSFLIFFRYQFSQGLYQDDEVAHYHNMLEFWKNPKVIMDSWAKPGYKILFVIPALLGESFLFLLNTLLSSLSVLFVYKSLQRIENRLAILGVIIFFTQSQFLHIATRNYAENLASFFIALAIWALVKKNYTVFSLIVSYLFLIRTEMGFSIPVAALFLISQKKWKYIPLLAAFPVLFLVINYIAFYDPFYFMREAEEKREIYRNIYPRRGFFHFIHTAPIIWGPIATFILSIFIIFFFKQLAPFRHVFLIFFLPYFGFHLLNNIEGLEIGYATGGNLRYMTALSSVVSFISTGVLKSSLPRKPLIASIIIVVALLSYFTTFSHNNITYVEQRNFLPFFGYVVGILILFFHQRMSKFFIAGLSLLTLSFNIVKMKWNDEHMALKRAVDYLKKNNITLEKFPKVLIAHPTFFYFYEKVPSQFDNVVTAWGVDTFQLKELPPNSIIFWENHYFYRPLQIKTSTPLEFMLNNPDKFVKINEWLGGNFYLAMFIKK